MKKGPIFIAGPDRSGTTLLYALMASHPNIAMVRRTNFWRWFYERYGDLKEDANFDRLLIDMLRYKRMQRLEPDGRRVRREFWQGVPSYGRLFELFQEHNAERLGKPRWGDKSLHTEHFVDQILKEFPQAKVIHMSRDPRDRFASVRKRFGGDHRRVGASTGRWLISMKAAARNKRRYPDSYKIVRYEDLAREPERTLREVCTFIGEPFAPEMLTMEGAQQYRESGGNSSFGQIEPGKISTKPIGRFRGVLSGAEIRFIQLYGSREMRDLGYPADRVRLSPKEALRYYGWVLPFQTARMLGWLAINYYYLFFQKATVPESRLLADDEVSLPQLGDAHV